MWVVVCTPAAEGGCLTPGVARWYLAGNTLLSTGFVEAANLRVPVVNRETPMKVGANPRAFS